MGASSDEELVKALQAGDLDSLGVLVSRWERPLFRFVFRLLPRREDARDVCQETFLRVLSKADRFREGSRFSTWMYQIALNLCRDQARKRKRWSLLVTERSSLPETAAGSDPGVDGDDGDPARAAERGELQAAVRSALETLPAEQREVVVLKEFEGLKFREIAEIVGCPESTVKSRMYYGLSGIRARLEQAGIRRSP